MVIVFVLSAHFSSDTSVADSQCVIAPLDFVESLLVIN